VSSCTPTPGFSCDCSTENSGLTQCQSICSTATFGSYGGYTTVSSCTRSSFTCICSRVGQTYFDCATISILGAITPVASCSGGNCRRRSRTCNQSTTQRQQKILTCTRTSGQLQSRTSNCIETYSQPQERFAVCQETSSQLQERTRTCNQTNQNQERTRTCGITSTVPTIEYVQKICSQTSTSTTYSATRSTCTQATQQPSSYTTERRSCQQNSTQLQTRTRTCEQTGTCT
jgi:hypothetical protein